MIRVLRGVACGVAWCCVVLRGVAWCCMVRDALHNVTMYVGVVDNITNLGYGDACREQGCTASTPRPASPALRCAPMTSNISFSG